MQQWQDDEYCINTGHGYEKYKNTLNPFSSKNLFIFKAIFRKSSPYSELGYADA